MTEMETASVGMVAAGSEEWLERALADKTPLILADGEVAVTNIVYDVEDGEVGVEMMGINRTVEGAKAMVLGHVAKCLDQRGVPLTDDERRILAHAMDTDWQLQLNGVILSDLEGIDQGRQMEMAAIVSAGFAITPTIVSD